LFNILCGVRDFFRGQTISLKKDLKKTDFWAKNHMKKGTKGE
jgi:hypothetical protein